MKKEFFKENSYYEGLIQNLYSGTKGCFVSFMQFFYQYNQCKIHKGDFCECFETLFQNELKNCEILSEILLKMGGDNKYYSSSRKFISSSNVDYIKNFDKMFLTDIELLEYNIIDTKSLILKIENIKIKNLLKIILNNKKNSLKILKENYFRNNLIK